MLNYILLVILGSELCFGRTVHILYNPLDVTNICAQSHRLSFDLTFGMGISDSISLVTKTQSEIDYQCDIEFTTDANVTIITVFQYPNPISVNCLTNKRAFMLLHKRKYFVSICDVLTDYSIRTQYFVVTAKGHMLLKFTSNSSINYDMDANHYQITATTARLQPAGGCHHGNESICIVKGLNYCFTNGVVCDGIKNCGFPYWFDERTSSCAQKKNHMNFNPMLTIFTLILCVSVIGARFLSKFLPPSNNAFLIYNVDNDNRLGLDPVFDSVINSEMREKVSVQKKASLIPISSSSDDSSDENENTYSKGNEEVSELAEELPKSQKHEPQRKITLKSVTEKFQEHVRYVTGFKKTY